MTSSKVTDDSDQPAGKRFGCLIYSLCFLAIVLLVAGTCYFAWYANAKSDLDSEIARILDRGEPLWFADLKPAEPHPEQDAMPLFLLAWDKRQRPSKTFYDLVSADPPTPPGNYPELASVLSLNQEALWLLRQATRRPYFRVPLDYDTKQPVAINLGAVQDFRELARILQGQVLQSLGTNKQDEAVTANEDLFGLSELLRDEPMLISQLVRIAIGAVAQISLKQTLAYTDLTPEQFAKLDEQLATIESHFTLVPAAQGERAMAFTTMNHLSENLTNLANPKTDEKELKALKMSAIGVLRPNFMADEAFLLRTLTDYIEFIDKPGPEGHAAAVEFETRAREASQRYVLTKLLLPALKSTREAGLRYRMKLITARLGMRVARYFAEHGKFPASLAEITDEKLQTVPVDLYSGKPLVYKLLPDGFTIYPLGDNGIDDGGELRPDFQEFFSGFEVHYPRLAKEKQ